jgi:hypothetical protein
MKHGPFASLLLFRNILAEGIKVLLARVLTNATRTGRFRSCKAVLPMLNLAQDIGRVLDDHCQSRRVP